MSSYKSVPKQPGTSGKQPSMNPQAGNDKKGSASKTQPSMNPGVGNGTESSQFNSEAAKKAWKKR